MAKIASCFNCVYSYCDHEHALWSMSAGVLTWPACANHPESYGRMRRVPERGLCPNYRPRSAKPEGDVRLIPLGNGVYTYVDAANYEWLSRWTWSLQNGYAVRHEKHKTIYMHRQIMQPPKGMIVDHKNLNRLDNTRLNLWVCTPQENACNRSKRRGTFSRFCGVTYKKNCGKYRADVHYKGEDFFCGCYTDELAAARARDYKAVEVTGESARLNFPEEWPPERRAQVHAQFQASRQSQEQKGAKVRKQEAKKARRKNPKPARTAKSRARAKAKRQPREKHISPQRSRRARRKETADER